MPADLIGEQFLLPKTGTTRARLNTWLDPVQDDLNVSMELDSTEMIKRFVMASLGCRFWQGHTVRKTFADGMALYRLVPNPWFAAWD